jgi:hypothetical protein
MAVLSVSLFVGWLVCLRICLWVLCCCSCFLFICLFAGPDFALILFLFVRGFRFDCYATTAQAQNNTANAQTQNKQARKRANVGWSLEGRAGMDGWLVPLRVDWFVGANLSEPPPPPPLALRSHVAMEESTESIGSQRRMGRPAQELAEPVAASSGSAWKLGQNAGSAFNRGHAAGVQAQVLTANCASNVAKLSADLQAQLLAAASQENQGKHAKAKRSDRIAARFLGLPDGAVSGSVSKIRRRGHGLKAGRSRGGEATWKGEGQGP